MGGKDVEDASGSAFAGEPSRFPARRSGRCGGADDRAPARHRQIAGDSAERSHHAWSHRRRQYGRRPRSRLPQDAGRPDPRHLRHPPGEPRTVAGRGQSAVWRFEMRAHPDFRELLARPDIDAVVIATGERWHPLVGIEAARRGKHIYCEKPLSVTLAEGLALREAVQEIRRGLPVGHAAALQRQLPAHRGAGAERLHRRRADHHDRHRPAAHRPSRSPPRR